MDGYKLILYGLPAGEQGSGTYWQGRNWIKKKFPKKAKMFTSDRGTAIIYYNTKATLDSDSCNRERLKLTYETHEVIVVRELKSIGQLIVMGFLTMTQFDELKRLLDLPDRPFVTYCK